VPPAPKENLLIQMGGDKLGAEFMEVFIGRPSNDQAAAPLADEKRRVSVDCRATNKLGIERQSGWEIATGAVTQGGVPGMGTGLEVKVLRGASW